MKKARYLSVGALATLLLVILPCGCSESRKTGGRLDSATKYLAKGDYAAAEIEFKNVLLAKPGEPAALRGLGLIWVRQGAAHKGAQILSAAKQALPKDDEVGVALAQALLELGFIGDSRKELLEALDRSPSHGEALLLLAETSLTPEALAECGDRLALAKPPVQALVLLAAAVVELRRGRTDAGSELVGRAIETDPNCSRAHALQGRVLATSNQPDRALECLKKASALGGPRSSGMISHARLLIDLKRQDEAVALLRQATAAAPDYLPGWRLLAQVSVAGNQDAQAAEYLAKVLNKNPLDPEAALLQSEIWVRQKEVAKAAELLEKIVRVFPSRYHLELGLAKVYLAKGDFRGAAEALDRVLTLAPGLPQAVMLRAGLHLREGKPAEAVSILEVLLAAEPANRPAQDLIVQAYRAANRCDDAIAVLRKQTIAAPTDPMLHLRLGQILVSRGKTGEARQAFECALKFAPDELSCVSQLIAVDQLEGKTGDAMARADAYLAAHPESAQAISLKAGLCYAQRDFKSAEALALEAIELNPEDLTACGMLVDMQIQSGRSEEAVTRLRKLLQTAPANLPARMQLSILLQSLNRPGEARASLEEMVRIAPNFAPAYNNLACIDAEPPRKLDLALENARKARSLAPKSAAIADTLGWIEWLRGSYSEALPLLLEAVDELPQSATAQYHLAMARYMMHQIPEAGASLGKALAIPGGFPEKPEAERRLAILRDGGKLDLAALETQLKDSPTDVVLILYQADKLAAAGRSEDAAASYRAALAVNPNLEAALLGLAHLYATVLNQPGKALEAASQARRIAPQSPRAAALLGVLNFRLGRHEDACNLLQEAAPKLPDDASVQADLAWACYSMGRVAEARTLMSKLAQSHSEKAADARDFLALTAPDAATDSNAAALIESKLETNPGDVPALMLRAQLEEKAGESPVETCLKVLGTFPHFNPARIVLARAYLRDPGQLEEAEKLATAARENLKDDLELSGMLAIIGFRKGRCDYAAQLLAELSAKRPLTADELFALGMSQVAINRPADALRNLARALDSGLPQTDSNIARAALEKLTNPDARE